MTLLTAVKAVKAFFERDEATEDQLIEETFGLLKRLDETEDPTEAALLEAQIAERSDDLPDLDGFAVLAIDGEVLAVCLYEAQARTISQALILSPGGTVTKVEPVTTSIENFVHPETSCFSIVALLTNPDANEEN